MNPLGLAIIHLLLTAVSVFIVAKIMPGIQVKDYVSALKFSFVAAILNAIAWGLFGILTIPFAVITLGIGGLIVMGLVFLLSAKVVSGVSISGCATGALASLGVHLVNWGMHLVLGHWAP